MKKPKVLLRGRVAIWHPDKGVLVVRKKGHRFKLVGGRQAKREVLVRQRAPGQKVPTVRMVKLREGPRQAALREKIEELEEDLDITRPKHHSDHFIGEIKKTPSGHEFRVLERQTVYTARPKEKKYLKERLHTQHEVDQSKWVTRKNFKKTKLDPVADFVIRDILGIARRKKA